MFWKWFPFVALIPFFFFLWHLNCSFSSRNPINSFGVYLGNGLFFWQCLGERESKLASIGWEQFLGRATSLASPPVYFNSQMRLKILDKFNRSCIWHHPCVIASVLNGKQCFWAWLQEFYSCCAFIQWALQYYIAPQLFGWLLMEALQEDFRDVVDRAVIRSIFNCSKGSVVKVLSFVSSLGHLP